ncbi:MAG TPA: protein kinase [Kofleriaceae bacterium]|nr:protein kinase [Kofleriaceae bacterium]
MPAPAGNTASTDNIMATSPPWSPKDIPASADAGANAHADTIGVGVGTPARGADVGAVTIAPPRRSGTSTGPLPRDQRATQPVPIVTAHLRGSGAPAFAAPAVFVPGGRLGQYELIRELGRGGMGTVYLARDLRLGRLVAIKLLVSRGAHDNARLLAEARVTARCNHENIVVIYDIGEHEAHPYMVFEYVAGRTLGAWLDDRAGRSSGGTSPVEPSLAATLMIPVVRALAYAHEQGIVHRDLKPANIMLTDAGTIKVLDFGIAALLAGGAASSNAALPIPPIAGPGAIVGTLPYMSPEQLEGDAIDHRTDVWAVGIMLYEMVTGTNPVIPEDANLHQALLDATSLDLPVPSVGERRADLGALAGIIDRCLIKDRAHRTRDARVLLQELEVLSADRRVAVLGHDGNPFAGLAPFQEADADRFYGRAREIGAVLARLRSSPLIALAGPSGVGKSSLVRAGVIPQLKRSGEGWDAFIVRPGRSPLASLSAILLELTRASTDPAAASWSGEGERALERGPADLHAAPGQLGATLRAWAHRKHRRVLVFIDQFEELYTLCADPAERAAFLACLDGVADDASSPLRVLLSIRSDFLDRLAGHRPLADAIGHGLMLVPPLDRDGLREALVRPVEAADCRYEDVAVIDDMLASVAAAPGSLPLLQFAAARLWTERDRERRLLTRASYEAMGGIAGTLAGHADHVLGAIPGGERALVRSIFERLVTPERTRAVVSLGELRELPGDPDDLERLVHRLVDARLLVIEARAGDDRTAELVHESLIERWPTLVGWLDENRDDAAFLSRLRTAAAQWQASDCDEGVLWRDEPARRALAWLSHYRGELGRREHAYLDAVRVVSTRAERRRRRVRRQVIAAVVAVPMILLAVASVALVRISRAEREASGQRDELRVTTGQLSEKNAQLREQTARAEDSDRESQRLLQQSYLETGRQLLLDGHPQEAMPYLMAVRQQGENGIPFRMLIWMATRSLPLIPPLTHQGEVNSAAFSPDGSRIVTASFDKTARIWDATTGKLLGPPLAHQGGVSSAAFSPDGSRVVTASNDQTARIWDATTGKPLGLPLAHQGGVSGAAFSPDGSRVVTTSDDKTARVWDATTGKPLGLPLAHQRRVRRAAFSPDGSRVVTASEDQTARVWDAATGKPLAPPLVHQGWVASAAFSPDGTRVVTASYDQTARVWDATTGKPLGPLLAHQGAMESATFSPDGTRVVTAGLDDKTARVWDAATGKPLGPPLAHQGWVLSAAFSPDGSRVVTASEDQTARVWDVATSKPLGPLLAHQGVVWRAAFSPDGSRVVTASADKTARVWDAASGKPLAVPLAPLAHQGRVSSAAFSPDGSRVVTTSDDKTARVWDAASGKPLGLPLAHQGAVSSAAFSPDGSRVVTASEDKTAQVWDAATGKPLGALLAHQGAVWSAAFSPDGSRVVTASEDKTAQVWDAATGKRLGPPLAHQRWVSSATFSPDGIRVVTVSGNTARVWDTATGKPLDSPLAHQGWVRSAAFSPDGTRVITASNDRTAQVWDTATGKPLGLPLAHQGWVRSAAFSPDGTRVVTASVDKTARVWDAATSKPLSPPLAHQGAVVSAAFSPDGTRVVTASEDKTARIWETRLDETPPAGWPAQAERSPFVLRDGMHVPRASLARGAGAN